MGIMMTKKLQPTLEQRVLQFIQHNELVKANQKILVAVSGGPDSVCLIYSLNQLRTELNITLHMAHLNHQLRGEESEADAHYVEELARKLNIPITLEKRDVAAYQAEHHLSLEEAAREVRYSFLAQTARRIGAEYVAVGHTLNDQVETILLHIIRGTGTRGLRGLQPCHTMQFSGCSLTVIRPLLEIKREETEDYCSRLKLMPCQDTSNLSSSLLRNRVRHELVPLLQTYNPGIRESLLRISCIAQDDLAFLEAESTRVWPEVAQKKQDIIIFDKEAFKRLAQALQRHLLRRAIDELSGTLKDIETRHVEEILEALNKPAGRQVTLPGGLIFSIEYNRYLLGFHPEEQAPFAKLEGEFDIKVPGETRINGWNIEAEVISSECFMDRQKALDTWGNDGFTAFFDKDKVGAIIKVRARRKGDWFQPLGMSQTKKVGEFMLDSRIPRTWRERVPIFYTPRQIIWIAGWRIDDRVKVTADTREILCLRTVRWTDGHGGKGRANS
jgi:tRNA(Ile)-lysidine synthase